MGLTRKPSLIQPVATNNVKNTNNIGSLTQQQLKNNLFSVGENFLLSILKSKSPTELQNKSLKEWFDDKASQELFLIIKNYYASHYKLPELNYLEAKNAKYLNITTSEKVANLGSPESYKIVLQENYAAKIIALEIPNLVMRLDSDPLNAIKGLGILAEKLKIDSISTSKLYNYAQNSSQRFLDYERNVTEGRGGITYLSTGHALLDAVFSGYGETQFIAIGGRAGTKKTWLLLYLAMLLRAYMEFEGFRLSQGEIPKPKSLLTNPQDFYLWDTLENSMLTTYPKVAIDTKTYPTLLSKPILFITNEMSEKELAPRMDAIGAKISYDNLFKANLNKYQLEKLKSYLHVNKTSEFIIVEAKTLSELDALISLLEPAAVFIDGLYLMEKQQPEGFIRASFTTQGTKALCMKHRVPIIATVQLRKGSGKEAKFFLDGQDEFYYGTLVQDADICIRSTVNEELLRTASIYLSVVKGRTIADGSNTIFKAPISTMDFDFVLDDKDDDTDTNDENLPNI